MKSMFAAVAIALMSTLVVGVPGVALAQDTAAGGYKIGVVDVQEVLAKYNKRIAKYNELEGKVKNLQGDIDKLTDKIKAAKDDYDKKSADKSVTPTQLLEMETAIRKDHATYESLLKENQTTVDGMEKAVLQEVIGDVEKAIDDLGKAENYHLILNGKDGGGGTVLYHAEAIDLTSKVLTALNGNAPAPAAAPSGDDGKKKKK